uniref:Uncharacterized protein n=1 Tax=Anopheles funestus TaxID=62324 RepID=A0A4Y0BEQ5_ANOFN
MLPVSWQKINLAKYNSNQHRKTTYGKGSSVVDGRLSAVVMDDNLPIPATINHDANQEAVIDMVEDGSIKTLDSVMEESFGNWSDGQ